MWKSLFVVIPLFAATPAVEAEIYKCPGKKDLVVYQNFPCVLESIGSSAIAAAPKEILPSPKQQPLVSSQTQAAVAPDPDDPRFEPHVGMGLRELRISNWGEPTEIVPDDNDDNPINTWHFSGNRKVVVNSVGRVISITQ